MRNILLFETDGFRRLKLGRMLKDQGAAVYVSDSYEQSLYLLKTFAPTPGAIDLILTSRLLHSLNGDKLTEELARCGLVIPELLIIETDLDNVFAALKEDHPFAKETEDYVYGQLSVDR